MFHTHGNKCCIDTVTKTNYRRNIPPTIMTKQQKQQLKTIGLLIYNIKGKNNKILMEITPIP